MFIPLWLMGLVLILLIIVIVTMLVIFEDRFIEIAKESDAWRARYYEAYSDLQFAKRGLKDIKTGLEELQVEIRKPQPKNTMAILNDVQLRSTRRIVGSPKRIDPYAREWRRPYGY